MAVEATWDYITGRIKKGAVCRISCPFSCTLFLGLRICVQMILLLIIKDIIYGLY